MVRKIGEGLKIFVLDDEKEICHFLKEFLERRGFSVHTALTAPAALRVIKKVSVDIAILDIYLLKGKMNGLDVLSFIKEKQSACQCLMVTRADARGLVEKAKKLGVADYLIKPLTLKKIEDAIKRLVKKMRKADTFHG